MTTDEDVWLWPLNERGRIMVAQHQVRGTMGYILVGLDGSETARLAFAEAVREAVWRQAEVVALHVVPSPIAPGTELRSRVDLETLRRVGQRVVDAELVTAELGFAGGFPVPVRGDVLIGYAGEEIVRAAQTVGRSRADLVVLGSRGLGGLRRILLGSVSTYAAQHLDVPLLIVPPAAE